MSGQETFDEFYIRYLKAHSRPETKIVHIVGTLTGIAVGAFCLWKGLFLGVVGAILGTYFVLGLSHILFEKNLPLTLEKPFWSFLSDFRMIFSFFRQKRLPSEDNP